MAWGRGAPGRSPSAPAPVVAAVLVVTTLVIVLATWAASVGPDEVFRGDGGDPRPAATATTEESSVATAQPDEEAENLTERDREPPRWLQIAGFLVQLVAGLIFLYLMVRLLGAVWRLRPARRRRRERPEEIDFDVLESPGVVTDSIVRDAADQVALLQEGSPRNGIVECWHRFEVQAQWAGLGRKPWETSSEFTLRLLDLVAADGDAVATLAGLYREARFSDHEVDEGERREALEALERIHRGLGSRVGGGSS